MTSLLDIFSIGFNSDGLKDFNEKLKKTRKDLDGAEKDAKDFEKELKELEDAGKKDGVTYKFVSERLEETREKVKKFSDQLKIMEGSSDFQLLKLRRNFTKVVKAVGALAAVGMAVKRSIDMYEQAEQIGNLAQKTDIAVESFQRLSNAASRFGGDTETTAGTLENLRKKETKETALKYGINLTGDPEQALENIARKMETLSSDAKKFELANSLGIDEGTTRLLIQGVAKYREELKRTSKYRMYTKEDIHRMRDYRQVQNDIRLGVENIQGAIARMLLPAMTTVAKMLRGITDWLAEHEGAVKIIATFVGIAAAIGAVIGVVKGLGLAFKSLLANPVVLTIVGWSLAIAAIIAVVQDFITWLHGGESALSGLRKAGAKVFDGLKAEATGFIDILKNLWDAIPEPLKKLLSLINPFSATFTVMQVAREGMAKANNNPLNSVSNTAIANYNTTTAQNENNNRNTKTLTDNTYNNQRQVNIGNITVQTQATNGAEVAKNIQEISQFDDGIVA